ncbi:hypothetical protein [Adhaeribacter rhizoryzae]|uniref:Uncharacterized protein n=1 Tax=Adhaeribacter rhizoryzae TaxID=2607907 RepID=A0A5M6D2P0_9BACT|nr:hypothetical protein [Adhaeribacter rhizoryzae]KAA5541603.1 hypothetical protein F0145_20535 [Adhaeribacter rhizoryzae]
MRLRAIFFAVYIFIGSLLPNSDLHEISKISSLIQHFQRHQDTAGGNLSLLDFLKMHYKDAKHMQSENHEALPFKKMGNSPYDYFVNSIRFHYSAEVPEFSEIIHFPQPISRVKYTYAGTIWQPPKIA